MIRQNINLGPYTYIVDLYDANTELLNNTPYKKFVMIRNYNVMNGIVYDTDIYFIERSIVEAGYDLSNLIVYPVKNSKHIGYSSLYTDFNSNFNDYSFKIGDDIFELFDENGDLANIKCNKLRVYKNTINTDLPVIVHVTSKLNDITFHFLCRKLSEYEVNSEKELVIDNNTYMEYADIYIPNLESLFSDNKVYFKNLYNITEITDAFKTTDYGDINNVIINTTLKPKQKGEELEMILNIDATSLSYRDFYIKVNGERFISDIRSFNINEDVEITTSEKINIQVDGIDLYVNPKNFRIINNNIYSSLGVLLANFSINTDLKYESNKKVYSNIEESIYSNFLNAVTNIKLIPYVQTSDSFYSINNYIMQNSDVFVKDSNFRLSSEFGFDKGVLSIINKFVYPNKNKFTSVLDAYCSIFNVSLKDYQFFELGDEWDYEDDERLNTNIELCGFRIECATDKEFKNIVFNHEVNINNSEDNIIDDYSFKLNGMFASWDEYPELLIFRCTFIDKMLNNIIIGNDVVLNKEYFKYLINENDCARISNIANLQEEYVISNYEQSTTTDEIYEVTITFEKLGIKENIIEIESITLYSANDEPYCLDTVNLSLIVDNIILYSSNLINQDLYANNNVYELKFKFSEKEQISNSIVINCKGLHLKTNSEGLPLLKIVYKTNNENMDSTHFNFIDKINCTIVKNETANSITGVQSTLPKVLYKPIFYKVKDLQNIRLKSGVKQNIGVNLSEYMTKVETFKMILDDKEYIETSRNDIYVIFSIAANALSKQAGIYAIYNQDDEYISDGNWTLY